MAGRLSCLSRLEWRVYVFFGPTKISERSPFFRFYSSLQRSPSYSLHSNTSKWPRSNWQNQNSPPKISVTNFYVTNVSPFVCRFEIEIVNPSIRATSLGVANIQIGKTTAGLAYFELDQGNMTRVTIPARDLRNVVVKAEKFDPPIPIELGRKTKTSMTFTDVFNGVLPSVSTEV